MSATVASLIAMVLSQVLPLIGITVDSHALLITIQTVIAIIGGTAIYFEHIQTGNRNVLGAIKKA